MPSPSCLDILVVALGATADELHYFAQDLEHINRRARDGRPRRSKEVTLEWPRVDGAEWLCVGAEVVGEVGGAPIGTQDDLQAEQVDELWLTDPEAD